MMLILLIMEQRRFNDVWVIRTSYDYYLNYEKHYKFQKVLKNT